MRSGVFQINTHKWGISLPVDVTGLPELGGRDFLDIRVNLSTCGKVASVLTSLSSFTVIAFR